MDWQVQGHKRQLEFLDKAMAHGKLAHGYLFAGPEGVGKKLVALKLAEELLGAKLGADFFHPDFQFIDGREGIKIEQIRELIYKLSLKPYSAKYKVAVLDFAEEMTLEAANAMLKSLEEPKSFTVIILISSNPNKLPKTITSRVQKINFGLTENYGPKPASDDQFDKFNSQDLVDRLVLAAEIADLESVEIKNVLQSWLLRLHQNLRQNPTMQTKKRIEQTVNSLRYLDANANSKLLLTNLMLNT